MAQPTNTFDTYDMVGIREDLENKIYDISPSDTPFLSASAKVSASNSLHEWQTDALRAAAANAHPEADDTTAAVRTPTVRLGNYAQIFKNGISISGSDAGLGKAGRASEMTYQMVRETKAHKLDMELAIFSNTARNSGASNGGIRYLAGAGAWVTTNVNNVGSGGANPTGDGTDARTDGTQTAFTQADFDLTMQEIWTEGGKPETVYLSPYQMNVALGFTGNNNQRALVQATGNKVINDLAVYMTPWGSVTFKPSRLCRSRDVWIMQDDMWKIAQRRPTKIEPLAKTGDSEKEQIVSEITLVCANEKASGLVADCSTS